MDITWPIATIILGVIAAICFFAWIRWKRDMETEHHGFQARAFALEERKFEVWKTAQLAHTAQQGGEAKKIVRDAMRPAIMPNMEPNPGNVVSMLGRRGGDHGMSRIGSATLNSDEVPTTERLNEIAKLISQAREMPEPEARAFLAEHGLTDVAFFSSDDDPGGGPATLG